MISHTGQKQELNEELTSCSFLAQALNSFINGFYLSLSKRDYSKRKRDVLWFNNMNVWVLLLINMKKVFPPYSIHPAVEREF